MMSTTFLLQVNWKDFLIGEQEWGFLPEAAIRSLVMFVVILVSLRLLGKRGVKQLSVFELGVIIGLGSAAGDPMFYKEVGLLPAIVVFLVVMALYKLVTFLNDKSNSFEKFVEGKPAYVISEGQLLVENFNQQPISKDELFSQLRLNNVSQLGQVERAILETNGELSIFYYPDDKVKAGLPILPHLCEEKLTQITKEDNYACAACGNMEKFKVSSEQVCTSCKKTEWVKAIAIKRIS